MKLTIDLTDALNSEVLAEWFSMMFKKEIEETNDTIENEELWKMGSRNKEEAFMHTENIQILEEYKEILVDALEQLEGNT